MVVNEEAKKLLRQGRVAEAEALFRRLLNQDPDNLQAINFVAMASLREGRYQQAVELLQHGVQIAPADALTQHHLGQALHDTGNLGAAAESHAAAVCLSPGFFVGRLHLARTLDELDRAHEALLQYTRAVHDAQQQGRWLDSNSTPAQLRPMVEQAVTRIRSGRRELFSTLLQPLRDEYGSGALQRVDKCLRIHLQEESPVYGDARQLPGFLFFPDLPTAPYFQRSLFPWIDWLESQTDTIATELRDLLPTAQGRERVFGDTVLERANLRSINLQPDWSGYYFYRHGQIRTDNCTRCPKTTDILRNIPLAQVPGHAPEVLFSVFAPDTHLLPHRGVTNTRLVAHLPLIVPSDCALAVGGEPHYWQQGRVVVFDDTFEHEAWNRSNQVRVVLIFDIWNPHLTEVERLAVTQLVTAIGEFRSAVDNV